MMTASLVLSRFFFFNDTATTEIYTLSLHDALPIFLRVRVALVPLPSHVPVTCLPMSRPWSWFPPEVPITTGRLCSAGSGCQDRKSTRLNSSHGYISYAVFCLKKKTKRLQTVVTYTE